MHEFSIAVNIIDIASKAAENEDAEKINEVEIEVGMLSGVIIEALEFALESAVKNTLLENAKIVIDKVKALAKCNDCQAEFEPDNLIAQCPVCSSIDFKIIRGRELRVKSINVD
ncbi:MAG: hydrogenase maturation nickel metallochaperone HypA [Bacteroidales bacterium]|nr:MAG: hydrogenase maturation nickel metallochaperone HypA [Bacteroidales bacterium]